MSYAGGRDGRDEGMARVERAADEAYKRAFEIALVQVCLSRRTLTSDDVKDRIKGVWTHEPRVIGPLMCNGARAGWMVKTEETTPCRYSSRHLGDTRVWRSLIFRGDA